MIRTWKLDERANERAIERTIEKLHARTRHLNNMNFRSIQTQTHNREQKKDGHLRASILSAAH